MIAAAHPSLEIVALGAAVLSWITWLFAMLETREEDRPQALLGSLVLAASALVVLYSHNGQWSLRWLSDNSYRGDALALAGLIPAVLSAIVLLPSRIYVLEALPALCCAIGGVCALAVGRSHGSWDFAAIIVGGGLLAATGVRMWQLGSTRRREPAITAIVFGTLIALSGIYLFGLMMLTSAR